MFQESFNDICLDLKHYMWSVRRLRTIMSAYVY